MQAEIQLQIKDIRARRQIHQDAILPLMEQVLGRPITPTDLHLLKSPAQLHDPQHWLDWFTSTLNSCEEARKANRYFSRANPIALVTRTARLSKLALSRVQRLREAQLTRAHTIYHTRAALNVYPNYIASIQTNPVHNELPINWEGSTLNPTQREMLRKILLQHDIFVTTSKAPGRTDLVKYYINTGSAPPIKQAPYRVSQRESEIMEAEIQQYLGLGLIRPSTSPWASPVLMIRKPDGSIRFCIDYRRLNEVTIKDLPRIDDLLDVLGNAKYFSTKDVASGYWNVRMEEDSIPKTAFTCKFGLYEWLVMPFGLCNAVPQFERLMEHVLRDQIWRSCLVYLDDVIVYSDNFTSHLARVNDVLCCFARAGFKLKMSKCHWGKSSIAFLGHIVTPAGILPNPEKVKSVLKIRALRNVAEVRAFLGLAGYFRRFIKGFAA
ncbi:hypothetical protein Ae201684P_003563 [Aphanomyces euteiches]|uniref:Reverse transcriptase domain-containing protein n=1 Tax=Aphanomyces euteiches TaxID=100861 RepID=A0A6G0WNS4_9STRA|nr:hypothetical protein Ae201684_013281 [Aphanomyces euteiches]KAH9064781.1 hypothetical protein Ae201684P_003563 [Aphanomyces euteiches]